MMRHLRLLGLVSIATLAMFVAPAVTTAQTPVQDQYVPAPDSGTGPDNTNGANNPNANAQPVAVQQGNANGNGKLPFTGGSVPLVALLGLSLLAAGLVGTAATRKRRMSGAL